MNFLKPYKKDDKYVNEFISKNKNYKNFIYNKSQDYNKENLYIQLKSILNHHYNKNLKENMNEKNILNFSNNIFNNKKKIKKNNKMVYINSFLFEKKKKINKKNKIFLGRKRSSKYRGVSRNGNGWQTLMMNNRNKSYIGTYDSEEFAARIYDLISIKKKGINAKTNFIYSNRQIQNILLKEIDFKNKYINENINQLINNN